MGFHIESYQFGSMTVNGEIYTKDLIILRDSLIHPWWRKKGHLLQIEDLQSIDIEQFETLIVGRGAYQVMKLAPELIDYEKSSGIVIQSSSTEKAIKLFNNLVDKGAKVTGAFHLTC